MNESICDRIIFWVAGAIGLFGLFGIAYNVVSSFRSDPPTHQERASTAQEQPEEAIERRLESQGRISSIEEMTETFDAQGNVVERTTRIVIYADKVEAEG